MNRQCPKCQIPLIQTNTCSQCGGVLTGLTILNIVSPQGFLQKCLSEVRKKGVDSPASCPNCLTAMKAVFLPECEPPLELDFCLNCNLLWFDFEELKRLPKKSTEEKVRLESERFKLDLEKLESERIADEEKRRIQVTSAAMLIMMSST